MMSSNRVIDNIFKLNDKKYLGSSHNSVHLVIAITLVVAISLLYYVRFAFGYRPEWFWRLELFEFYANFYGIIFLIVYIYVAIVFWWRGVLITLLLSLAVILPILISYNTPVLHIVYNSVFLSIPLLLITFASFEANWRIKQRKLWAAIEKEHQAYISQMLTTQEDKFNFIARELHDDSIQHLLFIANTVQDIIKVSKDEDIKYRITSIRDEILLVSEDLRKLSIGLKPGVLDDLGFISAIRWQIENFKKETQVDTQFIISGSERNLPTGAEIIIFRIVQEALNNIRRHSGATKVTVHLDFQTQVVNLSINDNGKGFIVPNRINSLISDKKLGLIGMQERVRSLNGTLAIKSKPSTGTNIFIEFRF